MSSFVSLGDGVPCIGCGADLNGACECDDKKAKRQRVSSPEDFSFCESVWAGPRSKWHVRRLTKAGKKLGGGIDTPSLCGHVREGWDLDIALNQLQLTKATCTSCCEGVLAEIPLSSFPIDNFRHLRRD